MKLKLTDFFSPKTQIYNLFSFYHWKSLSQRAIKMFKKIYMIKGYIICINLGMGTNTHVYIFMYLTFPQDDQSKGKKI